MTRARREQVSLETTPYYHCITRCVRRAFLCGEDRLTGRSFDHRRQWIVDRVKVLARIFAVDVCAYAVMSNHYHLVLRVRSDRVGQWTDDEVLGRWLELFSGPMLVRRYRSGAKMGRGELDRIRRYVAAYRARLSDLSWFMRCLNESVARRANAEDGCKGRFWEGRFKTQALLDEGALLSCMAYVDLNPIRAGLAHTPEGSDFTAIQERIRTWGQAEAELAAFKDDEAPRESDALPFSLEDYLQLVDWSGRAVREGKRGAIPAHLPPILRRLGIQTEAYVRVLRRSDYPMQRVVGRLEAMREAARELGQCFFKGTQTVASLLG